MKEEEKEPNDATVEQASAGVVASRAETLNRKLVLRKELKRLQEKLKELDGSTLCSTDG